jgi:peptidoglycan hydrolase CwlO-like protein
MHKFLIASALIATLGGNFSSALADTKVAAAYGAPAAQSSPVPANEMSYAVAHLERDVQGLQSEVQALQAQNQSVREENAQELDAIPTCG